MFTSTAFGRSAYVRIENQSILEKSVPVNEDEYCSDEEDLLDVGFMNVPVPVRKMRLKGGRFEIGREQECDGKMLVEMKIDSRVFTLPHFLSISESLKLDGRNANGNNSKT